MDTLSSKLAGLVKKNVTIVTAEKDNDRTVVFDGVVTKVGQDYVLIESSDNTNQYINLAHIIRFSENL